MFKRWLTLLKDVLVILALPVLSLAAVGLVLIIWLGQWLPATQMLRLNDLGAALLMIIVLIAFGYLRVWNYAPQSLKAKFLGGEAGIEFDDHEDSAPKGIET